MLCLDSESRREYYEDDTNFCFCIEVEYASNYISQNLKMAEIKLNIIPISFMEGYDMVENKYEYEVQFPEQIENIKKFLSLKEAAK